MVEYPGMTALLQWTRPASRGGGDGRSPDGHRIDLPEVTFGVRRIATPRTAPQHGRMDNRLRSLLRPLNLAALCTLSAVALSLRWIAPERALAGWAVLAAFTAAFLLHDAAERRPWLGHAMLLLQPLLALVLVWLTPKVGTAQVLLVIWTAASVIAWPPRVALFAVALADAAIYGLLLDAGHPAPLIVTLMYAGFTRAVLKAITLRVI
jgi:hypothetical protein